MLTLSEIDYFANWEFQDSWLDWEVENTAEDASPKVISQCLEENCRDAVTGVVHGLFTFIIPNFPTLSLKFTFSKPVS